MLKLYRDVIGAKSLRQFWAQLRIAQIISFEQFHFCSIIIWLSCKSQSQLVHSIYCIFLTLISSLISKSFWQPVAGKATLIFMLYQITLSERMKITWISCYLWLSNKRYHRIVEIDACTIFSAKNSNIAYLFHEE